jgi:hypothetical protein
VTAQTAIALCLLAIAGVCFIRQLRKADYSLSVCLLIAVIGLGQAGLVMGLATGGQAILFALVIYALGASAILLAQQKEDARAVIALGGSLGAIQIVDPAGGMIAALALPMLVGLQRTRLAQQWGLLVTLLFIPVLVAIVLASVANYFPAADMSWFAVSADESFIAPPNMLLRLSLNSLVFFIPGAVPIVWALVTRRGRKREILALAVVALAVVVAACAAVFLGAVREPVIFLGALAAVPVLVVSQWRPNPLQAVVLAAISTGLSWAVALSA